MVGSTVVFDNTEVVSNTMVVNANTMVIDDNKVVDCTLKKENKVMVIEDAMYLILHRGAGSWSPNAQCSFITCWPTNFLRAHC